MFYIQTSCPGVPQPASLCSNGSNIINGFKTICQMYINISNRSAEIGVQTSLNDLNCSGGLNGLSVLNEQNWGGGTAQITE